MQIGEFFTLDEMTATSMPFPNKPELFHIVNSVRLCALVLDPLRRIAGPLTPTSWFRSSAVNEAVGGHPGSFHTLGLAADIWSGRHSPKALLEMLGALEFDRACYYPNKEFMHVQIAAIGSLPRGELFVDRGQGWKPINADTRR